MAKSKKNTFVDNPDTAEYYAQIKNRVKELKGEMLILNAAIIVLGLVMIAVPKQFNDFIGQILGCILCIWGILRCFTFFRLKDNEVFGSYALVQGAAILGFGIFFLCQPERFSQLLNMVLTLFVLISAVLKLQNAINYFKLHIRYWWLHLIGAVLLLTLGIISLVRPPFADDQEVMLVIMTELMGISFVISAVWDIISMLILSKVVQKTVRKMQEAGILPPESKKNKKNTVHISDSDVEDK